MSSYPPPPPSGPGGPPPPPPGSGWGGQQPPPPPGWGGGANPPPPPPGYGGGQPGYGPGGYGGQGGPGGQGGGYGQGQGGYGSGYGGGPPPPPAKKRGALPWILGCVGCLGFVVIAGIVAALVIPQIAKHRGGAAADTTGTTAFVSSEESLIPELRAHYVPFSFRYPSDWQLVQRGDTPGASNFVKVEKADSGNTIENFAVGYMYAPEGRESDPAVLSQILSSFQQQFAQSFPNFQRVGDDELTLDGHHATGFKFTAKVHAQNGGDVDVFGRTFVLPLTNGRGLSIVMLGPRSSEIHGVEDLGVKGGLPVIIHSFRVGEVPEGSATSSSTGQTADTTAAPASPEPTSEQQPSSEPDIKEIKPLNKDSF